MTARLQDKTVVLVGGGQTPGTTMGNGRCAALTYAKEGAHVLVVDQDEKSAEETVALIRDSGGRAVAHRADITAEEDCASIAETALRVFGHIDVLHNNVGIVPRGRTEDLSPTDWRNGFEINLTGMWMTCKYVLPHMRARGHGAVINISSMAGLLAGGEAIAYTTSKSAVHAMTRSLALEYAPYGVRVNAIAPGMMDTPMGVDSVARSTGARREDIADQRAKLVPMGHQGTAQDVADAALFLASDESAFITGVILPVDGGFTLRARMR
ncbi:NAD(P)-dependent dehydrogenase (short-subunit alcohol dehydrogenase family) [Streptomyces sp. SAI-135]|uniref:SDR family NAD(P)-dependent oxidoreductase n=1 Tax=unclassified Streptomyces TaxID=2593676 RepID=UPI00247538D5|nr:MULTISPECIES: SDR family NAD(P)-dependent oxidoreductase [unclassified Streptomyces]MDH6523083.1 NAD(P)-dependent dehydrogenase (short-subunit alcohol dehydrogenase family) [Streptomyces sp. SAI-090]MDH6554695.1 NAD(P)-dependent dehydrogenase (short-subunit alcohol dehydrogenase family) [Streptomyces sp. SAI-041]MDH6573966.1 NAD(P)-dependent dehydrogenase (short-subunit alcohol dehydrogenase family) [Streptomyces sp. SAI-117]MDH6581297.1 NAD(P)-dependent dehydrogenase (short-subunit alcohol 